MVWRQGDGLTYRVNEPTQDDFAGGPAGITIEQFLDRYGFLVLGTVSGIEGAEYHVNGSEQQQNGCNSSRTAATAAEPLQQQQNCHNSSRTTATAAEPPPQQQNGHNSSLLGSFSGTNKTDLLNKSYPSCLVSQLVRVLLPPCQSGGGGLLIETGFVPPLPRVSNPSFSQHLLLFEPGLPNWLEFSYPDFSLMG